MTIDQEMFRGIKQPNEHIATGFHNANSMFLCPLNELRWATEDRLYYDQFRV